MKMIRTALLMLAASAASHAAVLEFSALLQFGNETRFVLTNADTGQTSGWIPLGRAFAEHALVHFDPDTDTLSLRSSGDIIDLPLRPAFSGGQSGDPEAKRIQILQNLQPLAAAAERYFRERQVAEAKVSDLAEHYNLRIPNSVDGEDYRTLVLRKDVAMAIRTRNGIEIAYPDDLAEVAEAPRTTDPAPREGK